MYKVVKVIYTNGTEMLFRAYDLLHNLERKMFFVETPARKIIMIPEHCVACIGFWDERNGKFE